jgi:ankyrin repeat protein
MGYQMETSELLEFVQLIVDGDIGKMSERLLADPSLATAALLVGATRSQASDYFFTQIRHYIYGGDTALHMAAAACSRPIAELLMEYGAEPRAKNRRGAEPLHYASDGDRSEAQAEVIDYLISVGADTNATDTSGVAPLHRAVRRRSLAAVRTLLDRGANVRQRNKSGSTPLHLAVQTTGASGSGTDEARYQQAEIVKLLLARGALPSDQDFASKTVEQAATSEWIQELLSANRR